MLSYFELLSLPQSFEIDLTQLESAYFSAQRQYHPDRFVAKPADERAKAAAISANLNDAYHTLKHPLTRAVHLLALQGITVLDEANTAKPDMALLEEIMELQEAIAEGHTPDIAARIAECEQELSDAFAKSDRNRAKNSTIRLSYLTKLSA